MKIADDWFHLDRIDERITLITEPHVCPFARCNMWHIKGRNADLLIDFGNGVRDLKQALSPLSDKPIIGVATHGHFDHIGSFYQFDQRLIHGLERDKVEHPADEPVLMAKSWSARARKAIELKGYELPELFLEALPSHDFSIEGFRIIARPPTGLLEEGDRIDLGDTVFTVLHLPGHSPGSIGLLEERTGILFSGDIIYDGPLLDNIPGADRDDYKKSMKRLLELPVSIVHAGHDPSFSPTRMRQIAEEMISS